MLSSCFPGKLKAIKIPPVELWEGGEIKAVEVVEVEGEMAVAVLKAEEVKKSTREVL